MRNKKELHKLPRRKQQGINSNFRFESPNSKRIVSKVNKIFNIEKYPVLFGLIGVILTIIFTIILLKPKDEKQLLKEIRICYASAERICEFKSEFEKEEGKKVNMYEILKNSKEKIFETKYYVLENNKKIEVRVICSAIPEDKMKDAIKRIKKSERTHQTKNPKPETNEYAKWIILVTSLADKEYKTEEVIRLYKLRWQIELLFKRMKQHLEAHKIPKGSYQYAEVLVYLWIITWIIVEKEAILMEKILIKKLDDISQISFWTLCNISYHKVKDIICGGIYANITLTDITENYKYILNNIRVREPQLYQGKFSLLIA